MKKSVEIVKLFPQAKNLKKATESLDKDSAPLRAKKYCSPMTEANKIGWYVYAPIDLDLMWDGKDVYCQYGDINDWVKFETTFLPDNYQYFDDHVPHESSQGMCPTFLDKFPEKGIVQIWTGMAISSTNDIAAWVRTPINIPTQGNYRVLEGIIETGWWTGGIVINIQIEKTDTPISIKTYYPLAQVLFLPKSYLNHDSEIQIKENDYKTATNDFWSSYEENTLRRNSQKTGSYARKLASQKKEERKTGII